MSRIKTFAIALVAATFGNTATAERDILWEFSTCAGRLSAQMEHEWLMGDPAAERTELQREAMVTLIDAVMANNQGSQVLAWRIDAKQARAVLLTRATFNDDDQDSAWASRRAETEITACRSLLLG